MCVWAIAIPLGSNSLHPHSSSFATGICFCSCFQLLFKLVGRGFGKGKGLWKKQGALEKASSRAMTKRLRGWQLEYESGKAPKARASKALEKADGSVAESALANKLLNLWAKGVLSATLLQSLAASAIQDGAQHQDLVAIAQTGNWGSQPGNCHRQIMNHFCSNVQIADPYEVEVPCKDPKTSKEALEKASLFLPHMMFWKLGVNYPQVFHELFSLGQGKLKAFWQGVEKTNDDKLKDHPMSLEKDWEDLTIPLFLHGDGVDFSNNDNLMVYSWGCLLSSTSTLLSHWLLACFPKSCGSKTTWEVIWKYLQWSFEALADGKHPTMDPDNKPLEKGSVFHKLAGQPLHLKRYRAVLWSVIGDHEFFANSLGLPHWNSHWPCWECDAQNFTPCTFGKGYKEIWLEKQKFKVFTHEECLADPWSDHALFKLSHISSKHVRGDPLHILFCKGLYGHVIGSILHYVCYIEGPGQRATKKPADRLAILFSEIQIEYSKQECKNRLTNLRMSMFTDTQKPWAKYPQLDCKGGEARHLLPAFIPVIQRLFQDTMEECEQHMVLVATSLEKLVKLWDEADTFLTSSQYQKGLKLAGDFLRSYAWLNQWSLEKDRMSFHIVPKHHSFIHLVWNSKFLNPRTQWCFKAEDFVGQVARLTHSVSMGVSSTRLSLKVAPKYRILVHLFLTRSMQEESGD